MNRFLTLSLLFLAACAPPRAFPPPTLTRLPAPLVAVTRTIHATRPGPVPTEAPALAASPVPSATSFPLPTVEARTAACAQRKPADEDLLVVVTEAFGLSPAYVPRNLVPLGTALPQVQLAYAQIRVRQVLIEPLGRLAAGMESVGLKPMVRSGYRSYSHQSAVYQDWLLKNPERGSLISATPGHSEHQLGLAIDFGSPELPDLVGDPEIEFHTAFAETSEGKWLAEHAHQYGFTLSYPPQAYTTTGLTYEPWHYRYVGVELATYLHDSGQFLTKFLLESRSVLPCVP